MNYIQQLSHLKKPRSKTYLILGIKAGLCNAVRLFIFIPFLNAFSLFCVVFIGSAFTFVKKSQSELSFCSVFHDFKILNTNRNYLLTF